MQAGSSSSSSDNVLADLSRKMLECPVCWSFFDKHHVPRVMQCGNNICSPCLQRVLLTPNKKCPICKEFLEEPFTAYPINRFLRDVASSSLSRNNSCCIILDDDNVDSNVTIGKIGNDEKFTAGHCRLHKDLQLQLRCMNHKKWICCYCLNEKHSKCITKTVTEAIQECKKEAEKFYDTTLISLDRKIISYDNRIDRINRELNNFKNKLRDLKRKKEDKEDKVKRAKKEKVEANKIQSSKEADEFYRNANSRQDMYYVSSDSDDDYGEEVSTDEDEEHNEDSEIYSDDEMYS